MKRNPLFGLLLVLLLPALLVVTGLIGAEGLLAGQHICLDPGHGGSDPGALNVAYGLRESDINLDVSRGLRQLLIAEGATVAMTRDADIYLDNSDRYTFCNLEQADILISVHTNSVTYPDWDGTMTLYGPREDPALAQMLHSAMYAALGATAPEGVEAFDDYGVDRFASGVLFKSEMPAAMVEPLFMSHPAEALALQDTLYDPETGAYEFDTRRGEIAEAILQGTLDYYGAQAGGELHVAEVTMSYSQKRTNYFVNTAVAVANSQGQPVPAADVTLQVTAPDGKLTTDIVATDAEGIAVFSLRVRTTGTYTAEVVSVTKTDWTYDGAGGSATLTIP